MKNARKYLLFLLAIVILMAGCGTKTDDISSDSKVPNETKSLTTDEESKKKDLSENEGKTNAESGHVVIDSTGREVTLPNPVKKSVVANAYNTEIINAIGALDSVVGVDYNIYQDKDSWKNKFKEEDVIGKSQKELNYEKIIELQPEVLILTGNGAVDEAIKKLEPFGIQVLVCDAYYTDQFEQSTKILGQVFGREKEAKELSDFFSEKLNYIEEHLKDIPKRTVYFEYRRIGNTTIPGNYFFNMVEFSHADNIFKESQSVEIDPEAVVVKNPEAIVKVSAPDVKSSYYPPTIDEMQAIKEELVHRPGWDEMDAVKNDNILLLSHYVHGGGSKLVGTMYLAKWLYPDNLPDLHPEEVFKDWLEKYQKLEYIPGHTYPAFEFED